MAGPRSSRYSSTPRGMSISALDWLLAGTERRTRSGPAPTACPGTSRSSRPTTAKSWSASGMPWSAHCSSSSSPISDPLETSPEPSQETRSLPAQLAIACWIREHVRARSYALDRERPRDLAPRRPPVRPGVSAFPGQFLTGRQARPATRSPLPQGRPATAASACGRTATSDRSASASATAWDRSRPGGGRPRTRPCRRPG